MLSLHRKTGEILWNKEVFQQMPRRKEGRNTYATPTAATDGERVYACFGDGSFAALSFAGEVVWTNRDYPFYSQHGLATSPILHRGLLIMARDGSNEGEDKGLGWQKPWDQAFILALDAQTGKERWKAHRGWSRISHGVPTFWEHDGKVEIVSEAGDVVQGFDAQTGERLWSSEVIGEGKVPSTVIGEGLVFTAGGWGGKESIKAFRLGGKGDLKETQLVWQQKKGMPKVPSMLYLKPHLFAIADNGLATCMKAATGEIVWQERLDGKFSASPVAAEGRIYFVADNGETTVIEAGPEFKVLAKNPLGEKVQASPAISQGQTLHPHGKTPIRHRSKVKRADSMSCPGRIAFTRTRRRRAFGAMPTVGFIDMRCRLLLAVKTSAAGVRTPPVRSNLPPPNPRGTGRRRDRIIRLFEQQLPGT